MEFSWLLRLLDIYPLRVPVKGSFVNWCPSFIFVTSPMPPQTAFCCEEESKQQLLRRVNGGVWDFSYPARPTVTEVDELPGMTMRCESGSTTLEIPDFSYQPSVIKLEDE